MKYNNVQYQVADNLTVYLVINVVLYCTVLITRVQYLYRVTLVIKNFLFFTSLTVALCTHSLWKCK